MHKKSKSRNTFNITTLLLLLFLLSNVQSAQADIVWNWSFGTESGSFTTTGNAADLAGPANFIIGDFQVSNSSIASNIGASYFSSQPDQGLLWDGSQITQFYRSSGVFTNGSNFFNTNLLHSYSLWVEAGAIIGELDDATEASIISQEATVTPSATPIGLPSLSRFGQLLAITLLLLTGLLGFRRWSV